MSAYKTAKDKKAAYDKVLSQFIKERKALHHKKEESAPVAEKKVEPVV
jgi:hypothetical protein